MSERKRYAIVGTGGRSRMYIDAICGPYQDYAQLVGFCDISPTRMNVWNDHIRQQFNHDPVPTFLAKDFDQMIRQTRPDVVIVTTVDAYHHLYIVRAMELGCDAVTEKPMTIDLEKTQAIFDAIQRTGKKLRVTFNYRYIPAFTRLREIVASGAIGQPTLIDFQWYLDTSHGADYFRRWHREMDKSGGLLVHKSSHHFDLVNFWIASYPKTVFAMADLKFYGKANAEARGEHYPYQRYTGVPEARNDPFALFLIDDPDRPTSSRGFLKRLYWDAEKDSGYIRDRNVFGDDPPITIYDTHSVLVRYRNNVVLNYSLYAYCPWEGERVVISGTRGQVEYFSRGKGHIIRGQSDQALAQEQFAGERYMRLQRMFEPAQFIDLPQASGGHGGGDAKILERIFLPNPPHDPFQRDANHIDGAASILTGIAANRSIQTGLPVNVDELFTLPAHPLERKPAAALA